MKYNEILEMIMNVSTDTSPIQLLNIVTKAAAACHKHALEDFDNRYPGVRETVSTIIEMDPDLSIIEEFIALPKEKILDSGILETTFTNVGLDNVVQQYSRLMLDEDMCEVLLDWLIEYVVEREVPYTYVIGTIRTFLLKVAEIKSETQI